MESTDMEKPGGGCVGLEGVTCTPANKEAVTVPSSLERTLSQSEKDRLVKMLNERQGTAKVKSDFIDFNKIHLKYGDVNSNKPSGNGKGESGQSHPVGDAAKTEPPAKKFKKARGMNHNRPRNKWVPVSEKLCPAVTAGTECRYGDKCNYSHDLAAKGASRLPDIADRCYNFETFGRCRYGVVCRFGASHLTPDFRNVVCAEKCDANANKSTTSNHLTVDLKVRLRKKNMKYVKADKFLSQLAKFKKNASVTSAKRDAVQEARGSSDTPQVSDQAELSACPSVRGEQSSGNIHQDETANQSPVSVGGGEPAANGGQDGMGPASLSPDVPTDPSVAAETRQPTSGVVTDQDVIRLRRCEKKQVNFEGKSYLAPLTTVGNLPFRRVCKQLGADITCGEMAMATNLLQGQPSEWALLKRHCSEDVFGVQLAGYFPDTVSKCAELINTYCEVDFVDLNVGCPIDLVYQKGGGSALMGRVSKFEDIVRGLDAVMDVPVTVKMRTGIHDKHYVAHKLIPKIYNWGASLVTLHGRSREQRYTRSADWNYIRQCVEVAKPYPLIGNGDILSYEDVNAHLENSGAAGVMIARGALIKPWIFTEIKEQRHWDISANERLDILKEFTNYGMEHWGSDTEGVEKTRRFLLEWLSFLHRYIPIGILEQLPQKIQERPPHYVGRNALETLMASTNCSDWVKISEMLLGPVPDTFLFLPKHKANSYS